MYKIRYFIFLIGLLILWSCGGDGKSAQEGTADDAPIADIENENLEIHGDTRVDPYFWMRLSDEQKEAESPDAQTQKVLDYLNAENAYADKKMAGTKELQDKLYDEMVGRIVQDHESVPYKVNGYWYYDRYEEGEDYGLYCRKKTLDGEEEIVLNEPELAKNYDYFNLGGLSISTNRNLVAYAIDSISRREYAIFFKDLQTGEILPDRIENTIGDMEWANDNKTLFYTRQDPITLRSCYVYKHVLGTPTEDDELIYEEKDETFGCGLRKTQDSKYLIIRLESTLSAEQRILPADKPNEEFKVFHPREDDMLYYIDHGQGKFQIQTNWAAPNYRIMECEDGATTKDNWKDVIPHSESVFIEYYEIFEKYLAVIERENGLLRIRIQNSATKEFEEIQFDEAAYTIACFGNFEYSTTTLRFGYESYTTPWSTYDFNMETFERELMQQEELADESFKSEDYVSERIFAEGRDGTKIPITMVYKKGTKLDGTSPLLLEAYGSYGATSDPYFSSAKISLYERGFIFATAHIRGGQEMGRYWYDEGKLLKKKNTFYDFIDCSEYLIEKKYTSAEHHYAWGASAGGLLMGAIVNMRPDLYKGVVAGVPFVDVVSTMLDESIPLTTGEFDEWGNPKNKEYYDYMLSYSPYDNVVAQEYPNLLITTGYWDSQVQYWEPAKWCAKLRSLKTDDNLLIMRCNMEVGHGGASGRFSKLKETAEEYAFYLMLEGIEE